MLQSAGPRRQLPSSDVEGQEWWGLAASRLGAKPFGVRFFGEQNKNVGENMESRS